MTNSDHKKERPIVVVDGLNCFIRHYLINKEVNSKSEPIGGVVGFIKFIDFLTTKFSPGKLFVIWENGGPSSRRKSIYSEYKKDRSKIKVMQKVKSGTATMRDQLAVDKKCKVEQLVLLYKLLKNTPVCQIFVKNTECDDIIAYLTSQYFRNYSGNKIIISSDKDFYQLLEDQSTIIYDPAKKDIITHDKIYEKYGIAPRNFCLARALAGDTSDNLEGVPGVGLKTAVKRFNILSDSNSDITIDDIIKECDKQIENKAKQKVFKEIKQAESIVRRNWKLMYLSSSMLSAKQIAKIEGTVDLHEPKMNKIGLIKEVIQNGISVAFDFDRFSSNLRNTIHG